MHAVKGNLSLKFSMYKLYPLNLSATSTCEIQTKQENEIEKILWCRGLRRKRNFQIQDCFSTE